MGPWKYGNMTLSAEESYPFVASAPCVLYSVVIANDSTANPAKASVYNGAGTTCVIDFVVPAAGTVVWTGCLALPKGLSVTCEVGAVRVTVMYV